MALGNTAFYGQFAKRFRSVEEMEAYKRQAQEDRAAGLDLQIFGNTEDEPATLTPSITPAEERKAKTFGTIRQGNATNALTKIRAVEGKNLTIDPITGTATIVRGNYTITIPNYASLAGLRTSTYQLLDALTKAFTESGGKSPTVSISLEDYMIMRGLKDRKEAKNQVRADLDILRQTSITGEERRGKNTSSYTFVNIADSGEVKRNGDIVFTYGSTFCQMLLGYPLMPYPPQLFRLNGKRNPNSFYFLRKISEHKYMNSGKKNEDIISVKTLLASTDYIPSYADVMAGNKNISDRIITPFERDMDVLAETLSWHYCRSNNEPLTDAELANLTYDIFKDLLVKITWKSYPDQTPRLERKAERIEQAKKERKKRTSSKKKTEETA